MDVHNVHHLVIVYQVGQCIVIQNHHMIILPCIHHIVVNILAVMIMHVVVKISEKEHQTHLQVLSIINAIYLHLILNVNQKMSQIVSNHVQVQSVMER